MANFPTSVSTDANLFVAVTGLQTTLAATITNSDTTITLTSTSGFPTTGYVTINNTEVVKYAGISGADLTGCTRGADGTTAAPHSLGVTVGLTVVAAHHNLLKDEVIAVETALGAGFAKGNLTAASSKIAVTGGTSAVIGSGTTVDLGTVNVDDLADVVVSTPSTNDVLQYNGSQWINAPGATTSAGPGIEFYNETPVITSRTSPSGLTQDGTAGNGIAINSLGKFPVTTAEQTASGFVGADTRAFVSWIYDTALGRTSIDAGVWQFETWAGVNSTAGGRSTTLTRSIYQVVPGIATVTFSGVGANSRTATITSGQFTGTYFNPNATNTLASYIQATSGTDKGLYQITASGTTNTATITVPTGYVNEATVTFNIWNLLLTSTTSPVTAISPNYALQTFTTVQPSFTIAATDKLGAISFVTGTVAGGTTLTLAYNGTSRNTHFSTPIATLHNELTGLQGGSAAARYHLTAAELTTAQNALVTTGGTMSGDITMSNNTAIVLKETTGNGTDAVTLKAPASVTTSYTLQLPPAVASPNQVLTDVAGNGVLSWAAAGTGTVNTGTANTLAYYPASSNTVDDLAAITASRALASNSSGLPVASATTSTQLGYLPNVFSYRRPYLIWSSVTTIDISLAISASPNRAVVVFPDGELREEGVTRAFIITQNAVLTTSGKQSGLRTSLSEATNTWYAVYAVKCSDGPGFVLVGDTTLPSFSNVSTLDGFYGANSWVYLGLIRNGDNASATGDILSFTQSGGTTLLSNLCSPSAFNTEGIKLATSASTTSLTYTLTNGTGTTDIPSVVLQQMYQVASSGGSGAGTNVRNSGATKMLYSSYGAGNLSARIWVANEGINIANASATSMDILLAGWNDSVLGIGFNPLV